MKQIKSLCLVAMLAGGGCALDLDATGSAEQALAGDHSLGDQIAHYNFGGATSFATRKLGVLAPNVANFTQLEADLTAMRASVGMGPCTRANLCLKIVNQNGSTTGPWPSDVATARKDATLSLAEIGAVSSASPLVLVVAQSSAGTDLATAITTMVSPTLGVAGATINVAILETDPAVSGIESTFAAHPNFTFTAPSGNYPGLSPRVVSVGASDYLAGAIDTVWAGSVSQCSAVFSAAAYEPSSTCAGKRSGADVIGVGKQIPMTFNGAAVFFDSRFAPSALVLGRLALQPTSIATRAQIFGGLATHYDDTVSGADSAGNPAGVGIQIPDGRGSFRDATAL